MAERDDDDRRDRNEKAAAAAADALAEAGLADPLGAAAGVGFGPLLEPLVRGVWAELSESARQRQTDVLFWAIREGITVGEMEERINASERTQLLTGFALSAATRTAREDKLRTLGRALASGLLAEDDATIDTEQMVIAAIADIEGPQLAMLDLLVGWRPGRNVAEPLVSGPLNLPEDSHWRPYDGLWDIAWREWSRELIAHARPRLPPSRRACWVRSSATDWLSRTTRPARRSRSTPGRSRTSSPSSMPAMDAPVHSVRPVSRGYKTWLTWHRSARGPQLSWASRSIFASWTPEQTCQTGGPQAQPISSNRRRQRVDVRVRNDVHERDHGGRGHLPRPPRCWHATIAPGFPGLPNPAYLKAHELREAH